jgi:DNA-binding Lrp family transcriptional regulator
MAPRRTDLDTRVLLALDKRPASSQKALAADLGVSPGNLSPVLTRLERMGVIVRETAKGEVSKGIRLVEARNDLIRHLSGERHYTPAEVAALVASGRLTVTDGHVVWNRRG